MWILWDAGHPWRRICATASHSHPTGSPYASRARRFDTENLQLNVAIKAPQSPKFLASPWTARSVSDFQILLLFCLLATSDRSCRSSSHRRCTTSQRRLMRSRSPSTCLSASKISTQPPRPSLKTRRWARPSTSLGPRGTMQPFPLFYLVSTQVLGLPG